MMKLPGSVFGGRRIGRGLLLCMGVLCGILSAGCQDQLFSPSEPRSQYDRFDAVRDRRPDQYVEDEFGNRKPNLRGRLVTSE